jgi:hypothetical protein
MLGNMTPGQLWTSIVAVITVLSTTFGLGVKLGPVQTNLVPCSQATGYPIGEWIVSGAITQGPEAALTPNVLFRTPLTGVVQTGEQGAEVASFQIDRPLKANQDVVYEARDTSGYRSTLRAIVSTDGCFIRGDWDDSKNHRGTLTMFWVQPHQYWVRR